MKAHLERADKRMRDGKKVERMSKTTLSKDFSGKGAKKGSSGQRETQGHESFKKMGDIKAHQE